MNNASSNHGTLPSAGLIYYGNSMRGTLIPGDRIFCRQVAFSELEVGDIAIVKLPERCYIHRVIAIDNTSAVTMGDNNAVPDKLRLDDSMEFFRLDRAVNPAGKPLRIAQGRAGWAHFRKIQRRRKLSSKIKKLLRKVEKLCFWRITLRDPAVFADGSRCYSWHGMAVARVSATGIVTYKSWGKRLFFRVETQNRAE